MTESMGSMVPEVARGEVLCAAEELCMVSGESELVRHPTPARESLCSEEGALLGGFQDSSGPAAVRIPSSPQTMSPYFQDQWIRGQECRPALERCGNLESSHVSSDKT